MSGLASLLFLALLQPAVHAAPPSTAPPTPLVSAAGRAGGATSPSDGEAPQAADTFGAALERAVIAYRFADYGDAEREATRALSLAGPGTGELAARYVVGKAKLASGDPAGAVPYLRPAAAPSDRDGADVEVSFRYGARLALAEALAASGADGAEAVKLIRGLPKWFRDGERRFEVEMAEGTALAAAGRLDDAVKAHRALAAKWHPRLQKDEVLHRWAAVEVQRSEGRAQDLLRKLTLEYPQSPFGEEALGKLTTPLDAGEARTRADALYKAREYHAAIDLFTEMVKTAPDDLDLRLALGRMHGMILRDDLEGAVEHLQVVIARKGRDDRKAEAAWRLTVILGALGRTDEALAIARDYKRGKFGGGWNQSIDFRIARLQHEAGRASKASRAYKRFVDRHKPRDRTMYSWFVGWAHFRGGNWEQALKDFQPLLNHSNLLVGAKALYWSAAANVELGRTKRAVRQLDRVLKEFPLCYYAVLAQRKLAALGHARPLPGIDTPLPAPADESNPWKLGATLAPDLSADLADLEWLVAVGDAPEARHRWDKLSKKLTRRLSASRMDDLRRMIEDRLEMPHGPRYAGWKAHRGVLKRPPTAETAGRWRTIYPRAYRRFARPAAAAEGMPELLLYCHMLQESRYKRFAISGAPAYGVMQFLEKSGRRAARGRGVPYSRERLLDPAYNARLGAHYLHALIEKYHGQIPFAVGAYNGGPRLMDAHLRQFGDLPFDVLVEEIDRHETRNYVRKILDHYVRYVTLYLPPDQRRAAIDAAFPTHVDKTFEREPSY